MRRLWESAKLVRLTPQEQSATTDGRACRGASASRRSGVAAERTLRLSRHKKKTAAARETVKWESQRSCSIFDGRNKGAVRQPKIK